jgi:hypothetical protein
MDRDRSLKENIQMSTIKKLIESHNETLTPLIHEAARDFEERLTARQNFARPSHQTDLEAQTGFIRIDRAFSDHPVNLFGQDVASLAHSVISITRGGEVLISATISEKALTEAVLNSNRGEGQPLTLTQLGSFSVPERRNMPTKAERTASALQSDGKKNFADALTSVREILADKPKRSSSELRSAADFLHYKARDISDTGYSLNRHLEEMGKIRTELLTEAAHAALHAQKVALALSRGTIMLPTPEPINLEAECRSHPVLDYVRDTLSDDLKEALRSMIVSEIQSMSEQYPGILEWISTKNDVTVIDFPDTRGIHNPFRHGENSNVVRSWVNDLSRLWNWAFNPHIEASRTLYNASQGALQLSRRSGWIGNIHSSIPPTDSDYFSLIISGAYEVNDIGPTKVRSRSSSIIEIEIVSEDLMMALRGHPGGLAVPCSIRQICGVTIPFVERVPHELSENIDDLTKSLSSSKEIIDLQIAITTFANLASAKRSGAAWLLEMNEALHTVDIAVERAQEKAGAHLAEGRNLIDRHIADSASQILTSISDTLPVEVLDLLQIPKS